MADGSGTSHSLSDPPRIIPTRSVNVALQYTPLASVTPVSSIANLATPAEISQQSYIFQLPEQQQIQSKRAFEALNMANATPEYANMVDAHLASLCQYLNTRNLRSLAYSVPASFASLLKAGVRLEDQIQKFRLSPFNERLLLSADVPFNYSMDEKQPPIVQLAPGNENIRLNSLLTNLLHQKTFRPTPIIPLSSAFEIGHPDDRSISLSNIHLEPSNQTAQWQEFKAEAVPSQAVSTLATNETIASQEANKTIVSQDETQMQRVDQIMASQGTREISHQGMAIECRSSQTTSSQDLIIESRPNLAITTQIMTTDKTMLTSSPASYSSAGPLPHTPTATSEPSMTLSKPPSASGLKPMEGTSPDVRQQRAKRKASDDIQLEDALLKLQALQDQLESLIETIFEADDNNERDTSGAQRRASILWIVGSSHSEPLLSNESQIRLDNLIRRTEQLKVYKNIPVDDIVRLQKICMRSVQAGNDISWSKESFYSEEEASSLFRDLSTVDNALKACKTVIQTMLGGRSEKQICSEDILSEIVHYAGGILDSILIPLIPPVLEMRSLAPYRLLVVGLLQETTRLISLLSQLLSEQDVSETVITRLEFVCIAVIFAENSTKEKDSFLGVSNVENLRVATVDVLSQIFSIYPDQRKFILGEILSSLEKLPVHRLSARQYRLLGGGSIQLVTALLLNLIQTAGSFSERHTNVNALACSDNLEAQAREEFIESCQRCNTEAGQSANDVINFLVDRAMRSSKSRDDLPYRVLLDFFAEDFITVLVSPEWPAAEQLLRSLTMHMISCANGENHSAQVNGMALDLLGIIGVKLLDLRQLIDMSLTMSSADEVEKMDSTATAILVYLNKMRLSNPTAASSYGYFLCAWTSLLCTSDVPGSENAVNKAIQRLQRAATDDSWAVKEDFTDDTPASASNKYLQFLRLLPLYKSYDRIFAEVLHALANSKITSRTKGLRVLGLFVARDPTILTRTKVIAAVSARLVDSSAQVRDAAVDTIGKYILVRPEVTEQYYALLCDRSGDTGTGVRKRVIKLLRDIYASTREMKIKIEIADKLLRRIEDTEDTIRPLAKKILEEMWFGPTAKTEDQDELLYQSEITGRVQVLLQTRERGDKAARLMQSVFVGSFTTGTLEVKNLAHEIGKRMVEEIFETIIDWTEETKTPLQSLFGLLSLFAQTNKSLFEAEQLVSLQSYLQDDSAKDELTTYYVLIVFRNILPLIGALRTKFTASVQQILLRRLTKFNLRELSEAMPTLRDTSVALKDTRRLAATTISCFKVILPYREPAIKGKLTTADPKVVRLLHILGAIGRYCNLEEHLDMFKELKGLNGRTVVEMIVMTVQTFARPGVSAMVRRVAVRNIGNIAISHPQIYMSSMAIKLLDEAFASSDREMRDAVIKTISEFFISEQEKADVAAKSRGKGDEKVDLGVLQGDTEKFANDGVCMSLGHKYINDIMKIATQSEDEYALAAVLLMERVIKQGFANPRACIATLIALETSTLAPIRAVALDIHEVLHEKYQSLIEGKYVDGIKQAFQYRQRIDAGHGNGQPKVQFSAMEPMWSLLKTHRQGRRKFLTMLCKTLDFDEQQSENDAKQHVAYVVYVGKSLAKVEFGFAEEPYGIIQGLDKIIGGTGMGLLMQQETHAEFGGNMLYAPSIARYTTIYCIWQIRQYIKRAYNLNEANCRLFATSKAGAKEFARPISRSSSANDLVFDGRCADGVFEDTADNNRVFEILREILVASEAEAEF
ncbi:sister chromatid cohesion C-terminus-domain-containing protein [Limtongia smithiae]|uniref:sister chromatid cohesion C-terminus-domain-containing protein n=1 Tax=Limtongia smithiae TaxID=1125753 RepID=UPI0034CD9BDB